MRNYIAVDRLNPNAINRRYNRVPKGFEVAAEFSAATDEEALQEFFLLCEEGVVGYSESNQQRVDARLYRSKDWYKGRLDKPIV